MATNPTAIYGHCCARALIVVATMACLARPLLAEGPGATSKPVEEQVPCGWAPWHVLGDVEGPVQALHEYNEWGWPGDAVLSVGGSFAMAGGVTAHNLAFWDGSVWTPVAGPSGEGTDGTVYSLGSCGYMEYDELCVGGWFGTAGGLAVSNFAWWHGGYWNGPAGTVGPVLALAGPYGMWPVVAGGWFSTAGGNTVNYVAEGYEGWWEPLSGPSGAGMDWVVYALRYFETELFAGGDFLTAGGVTAPFVARWDGSRWWPLSPQGPDNVVLSLEMFNDGTGWALYAGGLFTSAGGGAVRRVARWDGSGWSGIGGPSDDGAQVHALRREASGLVAGGWFTHVDGAVANNIARWNGSGWSALTGPHGTGTNGPVYAVATFDDGTGRMLYVGGDFTMAGGLPASHLARWVCEAVLPGDPQVLGSTSHTPGAWSRERVVEVTWSGASDSGGSGVVGYSLVFDEWPATLPDETVDIFHSVDPHASSSDALADGSSHWFHLRTCDGAGNCSLAVHLGPFWVDGTPPLAAELSSPSHEVGMASADQTVELVWVPDAGDLSGIDGYGMELSGAAVWQCDGVKDEEETTTSLTTEPLPAGSWFFHHCTVDNAGNWSAVSSIGPFVIVPGLLFADGFESGDTSAWSATVGF